jgi:hypothetical protein
MKPPAGRCLDREKNQIAARSKIVMGMMVDGSIIVRWEVAEEGEEVAVDEMTLVEAP